MADQEYTQEQLQKSYLEGVDADSRDPQVIASEWATGAYNPGGDTQRMHKAGFSDYASWYDPRQKRRPGSIRGTEMAFDPRLANLGNVGQMWGEQQASPWASAGAMTLDQQMRALGILRSAAMGEAPSAAESLMRRGVDENIKGYAGALGGARGGNFGAAANQVSQQSTDAALSANSEVAALRAQEMENARALYASTLAQFQQQFQQSVQYYTSLGLNIDEANRAAYMEQARMQANVALKKASNKAQKEAQAIGAGFGALSAGAAALL